MKLTKLHLYLGGMAIAILTLAATAGVYANVNKITAPSGSNLAQTPVPGEQVGPPITTTSGQSEIDLARHLKSMGAKMYGAYWCPHCHSQQELFGKEALGVINYIECDARGKNGRPDLCKAAKVPGFPTWEINNKLYPGVQRLEELAEISGYEGDRDFKNPFPEH